MDGLPAVGGGRDLVPGPHQVVVHEVGQFGLVVDGEDFGNG